MRGVANVSNFTPWLRVEALECVDEPEDARADQIGRVDGGRQAGTETAGDELDQRRVGHDQVVAGRRAASLEPALPLHRQVRIDVDDAHARGCVLLYAVRRRSLLTCV